jgi:biopolymer transport protein TolR
MRQGGVLSQINVTPLIDVMLVLLVVFMVASPQRSRSVDAGLPQRPSPPVSTPKPSLVLSVEESGLDLNGAPIPSLEALAERLRDAFSTRADHTLFVRAAGRLRYGRVIEVMDVARGAGADRLGLLPLDTGRQP